MAHRLENIFKKFLEDEDLQSSSMVILTEKAEDLINYYAGSIAKWKLIKEYSDGVDEIKVASVEEYKGLEADMVIYIHGKDTADNLNYIAYTRARYYLIELIMK